MKNIKWIHLGAALINPNHIAFVQDSENGISIYLTDGRRLDFDGGSLKDFEDSIL